MTNNYTNFTNITSPLRSTNISASTGTDTAPELEPRVAMIFRFSLSAVICAVGIVGNIAVCIVTLCNRKRSAVNCYILNLAIADLGILAICYPLTLVKSIDPLHWPLGKFVCKALYPLTDMLYGASIASIIAIAVDRYRAIVLNTMAHNSLRSVKWFIPVIWCSSFTAIVLPLYFVMEYIEDKARGTTDCTPHWPSLLSVQVYVVSLTLFWYIIPLLGILWCYRKIAHQIYESKKLHKQLLQQSRNKLRRKILRKRQKQRNLNARALKMLVYVVVLFAVTMLPFHVFRLCSVFILDLIQNLPYPWLVFNICTILLLANSSANPIIYSMVSADFRKNIKQVLSLQWHLLKCSSSGGLKRNRSYNSTDSRQMGTFV